MGRVSAHAGKAWWLPVKETDNNGQFLSTIVSDDGSAWNLSGGWLYGQQYSYKKTSGSKNENIKKVRRKSITTGEDVEMYADMSFDRSKAIGKHARVNPKAMAFAEQAFDRSKVDNAAIYDTQEICGGELEGHIKRMEYTQQILRVTFRNGQVCLFFRVPSAVAGTLFDLAKSNSGNYDTHLIKRHDLGKKFWQSIRIPGHHTGAKYDFSYEVKSNYKPGSNKRYIIKLRAETIAAVTGGKIPGAKPGDMVRTYLSEKELMDIYTREQLAKMKNGTEYKEGAYLLSPEERTELNTIMKHASARHAQLRNMLSKALDAYQVQQFQDEGYVKTFERLQRDYRNGVITSMQYKRQIDALTVLPSMDNLMHIATTVTDKDGNKFLSENDAVDLMRSVQAGVIPNISGMSYSELKTQRQDADKFNVRARITDEEGNKHEKRLKGLGREDPRFYRRKLMNVEPAAALLDENDQKRLQEILARKKEIQRKRGMSSKTWTKAQFQELAESLSDAEGAYFKRCVKDGDYNSALDWLKHADVIEQVTDENGQTYSKMRKRATSRDTYVEID